MAPHYAVSFSPHTSAYVRPMDRAMARRIRGQTAFPRMTMLRDVREHLASLESLVILDPRRVSSALISLYGNIGN